MESAKANKRSSISLMYSLMYHYTFSRKFHKSGTKRDSDNYRPDKYQSVFSSLMPPDKDLKKIVPRTHDGEQSCRLGKL